ncbi:STAS domain-containing protein [Kutzneria sp. NPDC051319]|uniref:STAS domain-containing protein n=1 Tax=Kutzneria sp. NPDC051319 TaxID=3155047 RepID=UPI00341C5861
MRPRDHAGDTTATEAAARGEDAAPELLQIVALTDRIGIRVAGQVDMTVRTQWESALAGLADEDAHDLPLDLRGLTFIDVRGAVALVETARTLGPGRQLSLRHPPEILVRIFNTMWPSGLPTITIEAP